MSSLFELDKSFVEIENKIIEAGGEVTPELEKEYDEVCTALVKKEGGYIAVNDMFNSKIEFGKNLIKTYQAKVKSLENQQERLKQRLIEHMRTLNIDEIEFELRKIKLTNNRKVIDFPVTQYPEQYIKTKIIKTVDKIKLKKDAKINEDLKQEFTKPTWSIKIY